MEEEKIDVTLTRCDADKLNFFLNNTYYDIPYHNSELQNLREENRKQREELDRLKEEVNLIRGKVIQLDSRDASEIMRLIRDISAEYIENSVTV